MTKVAALMGALIVSLLAGCVWLPHTSTHYDQDCDLVQKKMTLESYQVASIAG